MKGYVRGDEGIFTKYICTQKDQKMTGLKSVSQTASLLAEQNTALTQRKLSNFTNFLFNISYIPDIQALY